MASILLAILMVGYVTQGPKGPPRDVVLRPGAGVAGIADTLARAHVIRWRWAFVAMAELTGAASRLKAGEYVFPGSAPLGAVIDALAHGRVLRRAVTIPEGFTSKAAAAVIDAEPSLTGAAPVAREGALLPDTYDVKRGEARADVVRRMASARDALLARLWATRAPSLPYANPEQAVTLASIVEKETAKPSERPRIAAIFVHRLEKGMRLESDPTIIYGLTSGAPLGHGLRVSELASRHAVQHLQGRRLAADADRQSGSRLPGGGAASRAGERPLFRRGWHGGPRLLGQLRRPPAQRRQVARDRGHADDRSGTMIALLFAPLCGARTV